MFLLQCKSDHVALLLTTLLINAIFLSIKARAFTIAYKEIHDPPLPLFSDLSDSLPTLCSRNTGSLEPAFPQCCYLAAFEGMETTWGLWVCDAENTEGLLGTGRGLYTPVEENTECLLRRVRDKPKTGHITTISLIATTLVRLGNRMIFLFLFAIV